MLAISPYMHNRDRPEAALRSDDRLRATSTTPLTHVLARGARCPGSRPWAAAQRWPSPFSGIRDEAAWVAGVEDRDHVMVVHGRWCGHGLPKSRWSMAYPVRRAFLTARA